MAFFDIEAARKDGIPDSEIANHLATLNNFDIDSARQDGLQDSDILSHLMIRNARRKTEQAPEESSLLGDIGTSLGKGLVSMGQAPVGIVDIGVGAVNAATGANIPTLTEGIESGSGMIAEATGIPELKVDYKKAKSAADSMMSSDFKQQAKNVDAAFNENLFSGLESLVTNPLYTINKTAEAVPSMAVLPLGIRAKATEIFTKAGGGALGKAAVEKAMPQLTKLSALLEGLQSAGTAASDYAGEGGLTGRETAGAIGQGAATYLGGRIANKIGFGDIESEMATKGIDLANPESLLTRLGKGAAAEGTEETSQSALEQIVSNVTEGRDWLDGVGRAAVEGGVLGAVMGGGMRAASGSSDAPTSATPATNETLADAEKSMAEQDVTAQDVATELTDKDIAEASAAMDELTPEQKTRFEQEVKARESAKAKTNLESAKKEYSKAGDYVSDIADKLKSNGIEPSTDPQYIEAVRKWKQADESLSDAQIKHDAFSKEAMSKEDMANLVGKPKTKEERIDDSLNKRYKDMVTELDVQGLKESQQKEIPLEEAGIDTSFADKIIAEKAAEDIRGATKKVSEDKQTREQDAAAKLKEQEAQDFAEYGMPMFMKPKPDDKGRLPYLKKMSPDAGKYASERIEKMTAHVARLENRRQSASPSMVNSIDKAIVKLKRDIAQQEYIKAKALGSTPSDVNMDAATEIRETPQQRQFILDKINGAINKRVKIFKNKRRAAQVRKEAAYVAKNFPKVKSFGEKVVQPFFDSEGGASVNYMAAKGIERAFASHVYAAAKGNNEDAAKFLDLAIQRINDAPDAVKNHKEVRNIMSRLEEPDVVMFSKSNKTDTPAFKKWFGDSKVVDKDGNPLVMYHGTNKSENGNAFSFFDTYGSKYGLMGIGSYFTENPDIASSYSKKGKGNTPTVYKVFLSIKNPIDMDAKADPDLWKKHFPDAEDYHDGGDTNESWFRAAEEALTDQMIPAYEGAEAIQEGLRSMGYDGITHIGGGRINDNSVRHRVYIAFDPTQIKSATGNIGTFDTNKPEIYLKIPKSKKQSKISSKEANDIINKHLPKLAHHVKVVNNFSDLTANEVEALKQSGGQGDERGVFITKGESKGMVYIFADNNSSAADIIETVLHEVVGHKGVLSILGHRYLQAFQSIVNSKDPVVAKAVKKIRAQYKENLDAAREQYGEDSATTLLGAEVIAYFAESENKPSVVRKVMEFISNGLGKLLGSQSGIYQIRDLLKDSRRFLESQTQEEKSARKSLRRKL